MSSEDIGNRILRLNFNQPNERNINTLLSVGTTKGFRVIRLEDAKINFRYDSESALHFPGGISTLIQMFESQLFCISGSSINSCYPPNIVYFWDAKDGEIKTEARFRSEVKNILLRKDHVIIVLKKITYVYLLNSLRPIASIPTCDNEKGVAASSYDKDKFILATLDMNPGYIKITNFETRETKQALIHENPVVHLSLDYSGTYGASASEQGTIIRVFDCNTFEILHELRRGTSPALISSITFSPENKYLIATSNRFTIHLWRLENPQNNSVSGMFSKYLPTYFQYERSTSKLTLNPDISWTCPLTVSVGPLACFVNNDEFCVANLDGNLYKCKINEADLSMKVYEVKPFLDFNENIVEGDREWSSFE